MNNPYNMKIVADSSSDVFVLEEAGIPYATAPLKILAASKEYVDDASLDIPQMVHDLLSFSGKSSTACPAPGDWLTAFGDAPYIFCITITSNLSGSYNSANIAKQTYEEAYPDRKVFVIDSLSTGPEMKLIIEKLQEQIDAGHTFEEICDAVTEYKKHTGLLFMLESLRNLANNGRVSHLVAGAAGILNIRVIGKASDVGTLEPLTKSRGEKKALQAMVDLMRKLGHNGGKVRIGHCLNEQAALKIKELILAEFTNAQVEIYKLGGLCSFYAEKGGLIIGFEKQGATA